MAKSTKYLGQVILMLVFASLILISAHFIYSNYNSSLKFAELDALMKLQCISQTVALQIDGDQHQQMMLRNKQKDAITSNQQDSAYYEIHSWLKACHKTNMLKSDLYTLVLNQETRKICFGVTSGENPYFRHRYEHFPGQLLEKFQTGSVVPMYKDENGVWLSSFTPIKNSNGNVVAVVQVDEKFDSFIGKVRRRLWGDIAISLFILLIVSGLLYYFLRKILANDRAIKMSLERSKQLVETKNIAITDSIRYAKRIQDAMLPSKDSIKSTIGDVLIFFKPKDIVSGDFYWFAETESKYIIVAADCTGHGVPGAFMSLIGNTALNQIVKQFKIDQPAEILDNLDAKVKNALKQESEPNTKMHDGMDIAVCTLSKDKKELEYAGAYRPLVYIRNNEICEIKGDKFPIGGTQIKTKNKVFTNNNLLVKPNDAFYIFSDGYPDQFCESTGKKIMTKNFKQYLLEIHHLDLSKQEQMLKERFQELKGNHRQMDDVLVIGFKI